EMDNPGTTMEEYVQFKTERALRNGEFYNWETANFESDLSSEPALNSDVNLKNETPLSEYNFSEGMPLNIIKNLYVSFGIPFDPKLFYKDGAYTNVAEAKDFESRLGRIYDRQVHRVQALDFYVLTEDMDRDMTDRLRMEHADAQGQGVHGLRESLGEQRMFLERMSSDQARFRYSVSSNMDTAYRLPLQL
ncbi:hypothetical protein Tco_0984109, partial [Tanacetum coccineum]